MDIVIFATDLITSGFEFIKDNFTTFWMIFALYFVVKNMDGINQALKGGNGVWQMNEVAILVLSCLAVFVFIKDGTRTHEWRHFSDIEVILLLFSLMVLAKLDRAIELFIDFVNRRKNDRIDKIDHTE